MGEALLKVTDLVKHFPIRERVTLAKNIRTVKAVDGITFSIKKGDTLGLVGESGCGKSTTGRLILRLLQPTSGRIEYDGKNISELSSIEMLELRKEMQIVFQDPYGSLNPRMTVKDIIGEPLEIHGIASGKDKQLRVKSLLEIVGLPVAYMSRYPHEFSGGQRQRIGIARALSLDPALIVLDEPVSALDVSIQAQVINLLQDLQERFSLTYLFISHDLRVVKHISDRVAVMYLGKLMEVACKNDLYDNPLHPYTEALLSAVPIPNPGIDQERILLEGDVPSPIDPPGGCGFHTRCRYVQESCQLKEPCMTDVGNGHYVACHLYAVK
jgi:oligopeptide transport system ATP-binding protein